MALQLDIVEKLVDLNQEFKKNQIYVRVRAPTPPYQINKTIFNIAKGEKHNIFFLLDY